MGQGRMHLVTPAKLGCHILTSGMWLHQWHQDPLAPKLGWFSLCQGFDEPPFMWSLLCSTLSSLMVLSRPLHLSMKTQSVVQVTLPTLLVNLWAMAQLAKAQQFQFMSSMFCPSL